MRLPDLYIEESSIPPPIEGAETSVAAFVGRTLRGPVGRAVHVRSFGDYERTFGGLWDESPLSYGLHGFFLNGGCEALVVRVHNGALPARLSLPAGSQRLELRAASEGAWETTWRRRSTAAACATAVSTWRSGSGTRPGQS